MDFTTAIQELGGLLGLPELKLDEDQTCTLTLDGDVSITLELDADAGEALFYASLGAVEDSEAGYRQALSLSLLGAHTGGAALSLDDSTGELVLWKRRSAVFADGEELQKALSAFLDASLHVRKLLNAAPAEEAAPAPEPELPPPEGPDTMSPAFWA